jgi:uncharacterized damage-inducible protein DinB
MITPCFVTTMARYNQWQNGSLYAAADTLADEARRVDRGAFFKSIHGTLSHLLWADSMWMSRIAGDPSPGVGLAESASFCPDWQEMRRRRAAMDERLIHWAESLDAAALAGDFSWHSNATRTQLTRPRALIVVHMFNHQAHHRGQAHAMVTAAGARPLDTDLIFMPATGQ